MARTPMCRATSDNAVLRAIKRDASWRPYRRVHVKLPRVARMRPAAIDFCPGGWQWAPQLRPPLHVVASYVMRLQGALDGAGVHIERPQFVALVGGALNSNNKCYAIDAHQAFALVDVPESIVIARLQRPIGLLTMDLAPQTHLTKLRDLLTDRWLELRAEVEAAEQAQRVATDAAAHEVTDRKDEAAQRLFSDLGGAQEQRDVDEMTQVEAAFLHRLEGGTYGNCEGCGQPILPQRLLVQPAAERCTPCQVAREHGSDRFTPRRAS